jgi:hypothetical protein
MRNHPWLRVALGALALLTTLVVVAPVEARSPVRKIEPRRVVPYRVGGRFTPNTDVLSVSGYAAWMIDEALGLTTPLPPLGAAFLRAEREQGINARFFVAHAMLESGWGTSPIAQYKRNLFGYNAYDRDPWRYATRFPSHAKGVAAVSAILRDSYLTPGGRWWYRFTTPRAINRYYASDPRWADKVATLANEIDRIVVTLRERWVIFRRPALAEQPVTGAPAVLEIPWRAKPGAQLPGALRFAVRWTPVAVVETSAEVPPAVPGAEWRFAPRTDKPGDAVRLELTAPSLPGLWRLDVEARDSDGQLLPATDRPPIPSLEVRVLAPGEIGVALSVGDDGGLAATVTIAGPGPAADDADRDGPDAPDRPADPGRPAEPGEVEVARAAAVPAASPAGADATGPNLAGAALELWTLPLDPALGAYRQTLVPLPKTLGPRTPWTVSVGAPAVAAVVVARITSFPGSGVSAVPTAALSGRDADGRLALTSLAIASPRDDVLLGREPASARIAVAPVEAPGSVRVAATGGAPAPVIGVALAAIEEPPGRPSLLVRSLAAEPQRPASPTDSHVELPAEPPTPALVDLSGLPAGVRLVVAALVPADGGPADSSTIRLAWIPVAAAAAAEAGPS